MDATEPDNEAVNFDEKLESAMTFPQNLDLSDFNQE